MGTKKGERLIIPQGHESVPGLKLKKRGSSLTYVIMQTVFSGCLRCANRTAITIDTEANSIDLLLAFTGFILQFGGNS